ncbi:MAG TPA: phosphohydrolase [Treponema sp.]|nr:MAG: phosphohydrolase [Treponema sp. GWA1_62_8]OHE63908.1 MAG: phosphohydrolase [Treponema sp. GWC1_61_84]HCM25228.1 phosphohydrolase [Treponema sp.]
MGKNVAGDAAAALEEGFRIPVRDPLWGHIYLTEGFSALLTAPAFRKLGRIQQLGPASIVYPGATHTRASHSLGVYHLARRLLKTLVERGADGWTSSVGARSFLAAALLHDLGHFPYAHSLKELPLRDHEALTADLVLEEPLKSLLPSAGADPAMVAAIVDKGRDGSAGEETLFYRALLSGVLDPDKLDYLNRDARYCGVPYGAQDVDFTFSRLSPHPERGVDIDSRGISSVEAVLFAKYLMYRSVYWHRDVRAATAMMKKAVATGLADGILSSSELYGLDDAGLFALLEGREHPAFALAAAVREGRIHPVVMEIPWNGSGRDRRDIDLLERDLASLVRELTGMSVGAQDLILDLPEPISFETGLFVQDEGVPFMESSTVFSRATVEAFARSLRVLRVCVRADIAEALAVRRPAGDQAIGERIAQVR